MENSNVSFRGSYIRTRLVTDYILPIQHHLHSYVVIMHEISVPELIPVYT